MTAQRWGDVGLVFMASVLHAGLTRQGIWWSNVLAFTLVLMVGMMTGKRS